jgi:hypothetical protein
MIHYHHLSNQGWSIHINVKSKLSIFLDKKGQSGIFVPEGTSRGKKFNSAFFAHGVLRANVELYVGTYTYVYVCA